MNSSTNITKLQPDGLNYGYWSAYLEALLEENNIRLLSDESFQKLREVKEKEQEYRKLNGMAKRIIMQTVPDDDISYIKAYKNADEIWMKMRERYGTPSQGCRQYMYPILQVLPSNSNCNY